MKTCHSLHRLICLGSIALAISSCTEPVFDNPLDSQGKAYAPLTVEIVGANPTLVEVGAVFIDSGVVVIAADGNDYSRNVTMSGETVLTDTPDTFVVVYAVSDGRGYTVTSSRTVVVVPAGTLSAGKPRITLLGGDTLFHTVGTAFADPGASAVDAAGGNISSSIVVSGSVNDTLIGTYVLSYTAIDTAGNQSSRVRIVRVISGTITIDTVPPVITILGPNPAQAGVGLAYIDEGASAVDNSDGDVSALIQTRSTVNTDRAGVDTVVYSVSDRAGNRAEARRVVRVVEGDVDAPVITLVGANPLVLTVGDTLRDPGATALDNADGDLTARIVMEHNVNTRVAGTYSITYRVTDAAGNTGVKTRVVQVRATVSADTIPPVITLVGASPLILTVGATFTDPGASARDETDGDITSRIQMSHNVNTALAGSYTVTYTVLDAAGNQASRLRTVTVREPVVDTTKPVITLKGDSPLRLAVGAAFTDPGATASDNVDGNLSAQIQATHTVNTAVAGTYTVTYTVSDESGNTASAVRSVIVSEGGAAQLEMNVNIPGDISTTYTFAKYTSPDNWTPEQIKIVVQPQDGGPISGSITVNGVTYQLTSQYYNAITVPNAAGTVTCSITGAFQIGLGL